MPEDEEKLQAFLVGIETSGKGDSCENALEAIAKALKSQWADGDIRRHVVLVFSNSPAVPLGAIPDNPNSPNGMPHSLEELRDWWEGNSEILGSTFEAEED